MRKIHTLLTETLNFQNTPIAPAILPDPTGPIINAVPKLHSTGWELSTCACSTGALGTDALQQLGALTIWNSRGLPSVWRGTCECCIKGKMASIPFTMKSTSETEAALDLIHTVACGPMQTVTSDIKRCKPRSFSSVMNTLKCVILLYKLWFESF